MCLSRLRDRVVITSASRAEDASSYTQQQLLQPPPLADADTVLTSAALSPWSVREYLHISDSGVCQLWHMERPDVMRQLQAEAR